MTTSGGSPARSEGTGIPATRVEARLELEAAQDRERRARLRRSAPPAALALFLVLAVTLLGDRLSLAADAGTWAWYGVFGAAALAGLGWNHRAAGRAIRDAKRHIGALERRLARDAGTPEIPAGPF